MDPEKLDLQYIYADKYDTRLDTTVYSNGEMQVSIFLSLNYNDKETETTVQEITSYVQQNAVVYSLTESKNVDWPKSTTDNGFQHDVNNAATKEAKNDTSCASRHEAAKGRYEARKDSPDGRKGRSEARKGSPEGRKGSPDGRKGRPEGRKGRSARILADVRVPLYFQVPRSKSGKHRWIAKLDGRQTSTDSPVVITVVRFNVGPGDFEIHDIELEKPLVYQSLRVLRYTSGALPPGHKLEKPLEYKGYKFTSGGTYDGYKSWISMLHSSQGHKAACFVEYRNTKIGRVASNDLEYTSGQYLCSGPPEYSPLTTSRSGWEESYKFKENDIELAWNEGIPMLYIHVGDLRIVAGDFLSVDYEMQGLRFQDNFGNIMSLNFNWDHTGQWWGVWAVSGVTVENN